MGPIPPIWKDIIEKAIAASAIAGGSALALRAAADGINQLEGRKKPVRTVSQKPVVLDIETPDASLEDSETKKKKKLYRDFKAAEFGDTVVGRMIRQVTDQFSVTNPDAKSIFEVPLAYPIIGGAGLAAGVGGWRLADNYFDGKRKERDEADMEEAHKAYTRALRAQFKGGDKDEEDDEENPEGAVRKTAEEGSGREDGLSEYDCPKCGGTMLNGIAGTSTRFRGSAVCQDCDHSCSALAMTARHRQESAQKKAFAGNDDIANPWEVLKGTYLGAAALAAAATAYATHSYMGRFQDDAEVLRKAIKKREQERNQFQPPPVYVRLVKPKVKKKEGVEDEIDVVQSQQDEEAREKKRMSREEWAAQAAPIGSFRSKAAAIDPLAAAESHAPVVAARKAHEDLATNRSLSMAGIGIGGALGLYGAARGIQNFMSPDEDEDGNEVDKNWGWNTVAPLVGGAALGGLSYGMMPSTDDIDNAYKKYTTRKKNYVDKTVYAENRRAAEQQAKQDQEKWEQSLAEKEKQRLDSERSRREDDDFHAETTRNEMAKKDLDNEIDKLLTIADSKRTLLEKAERPYYNFLRAKNETRKDLTPAQVVEMERLKKEYYAASDAMDEHTRREVELRRARDLLITEQQTRERSRGVPLEKKNQFVGLGWSAFPDRFRVKLAQTSETPPPKPPVPAPTPAKDALLAATARGVNGIAGMGVGSLLAMYGAGRGLHNLVRDSEDSEGRKVDKNWGWNTVAPILGGAALGGLSYYRMPPSDDMSRLAYEYQAEKGVADPSTLALKLEPVNK